MFQFLAWDQTAFMNFAYFPKPLTAFRRQAQRLPNFEFDFSPPLDTAMLRPRLKIFLVQVDFSLCKNQILGYFFILNSLPDAYTPGKPKVIETDQTSATVIWPEAESQTALTNYVVEYKEVCQKIWTQANNGLPISGNHCTSIIIFYVIS